MLTTNMLIAVIAYGVMMILLLWLHTSIRKSVRKLYRASDDLQDRLSGLENKINRLESALREKEAGKKITEPGAEAVPPEPDEKKEKDMGSIIRLFNQSLSDREKLKKWINDHEAKKVSLKLDAFHSEIGQDSEPVIETDSAGYFVLFRWDNRYWLAPTRAIPYDTNTSFVFKKSFEVEVASGQSDLRITQLVKPALCRINGDKWSIQEYGKIKVS